MKIDDLKSHYNKWHQNVYQTDLVDIPEFDKKCFYQLLEYLDKNNKIENGDKILDIACGKGYFLTLAKQKGLDVFGLDLSDVAINSAKNNIKDGSFTVGDAENMPYNNDYFDYVTCLGSLEHFFSQEKGIKEISRVLKKDGISLIYVPNLMFLGHIYMTYKYGVMPSEGEQNFSEKYFTYKGWKELIEKNGLEVIQCFPYNEIYNTKKASKTTLFLWKNFLKFFVPFNLSYVFVFICKKNKTNN